MLQSLLDLGEREVVHAKVACDLRAVDQGRIHRVKQLPGERFPELTEADDGGSSGHLRLTTPASLGIYVAWNCAPQPYSLTTAARYANECVAGRL
jgi:hypothetical protein